MKVPIIQVKKLDDRSRAVVYLGREPGTKAHRLFDPKAGKLYISKDVVVDETKGWLWNEKDCRNLEAAQDTFTIVENAATTAEAEEPTTPTQAHFVNTPSSNEESSGEASSEPRKFHPVRDVYNDTEEIELDEELMFLDVNEPTTYNNAVKEKAWEKAMQCEMESIEKNNTWSLVELPAGQKAIGLKWVYKLKRNADGQIIKHKARLVAKGYVQKQGVDFEEAFAPVTRMETVCLLLALAANNGWEVHHLDVKSAFLNGDLQEDVYVSQPEGFIQEGKEH